MTPRAGNCFNCDAHVGPESHCYGCEAHVCSVCDVNYSLCGPHDADAHLIDVEESDGE